MRGISSRPFLGHCWGVWASLDRHLSALFPGSFQNGKQTNWTHRSRVRWCQLNGALLIECYQNVYRVLAINVPLAVGLIYEITENEERLSSMWNMNSVSRKRKKKKRKRNGCRLIFLNCHVLSIECKRVQFKLMEVNRYVGIILRPLSQLSRLFSIRFPSVRHSFSEEI